MKTIELRVKKCSSTLSKITGLIGKNTIESLHIQTRFGIHTFGVQFPIDVVILNDTSTIVCVKTKLNPNRVYFWPIQYSHVLELPAGTISQKNLHIGSKVKIVYR